MGATKNTPNHYWGCHDLISYLPLRVASSLLPDPGGEVVRDLITRNSLLSARVRGLEQRQHTCQDHAKEVLKGGACCWCQLAAANEQIKTLEKWKSEALVVLNACDFQEVGRTLGLPLGSDIASAILPKIKELQSQVHKLLYALNPQRWTKEMSDAWHQNIPDVNAAFCALRDVAIRWSSNEKLG